MSNSSREKNISRKIKPETNLLSLVIMRFPSAQQMTNDRDFQKISERDKKLLWSQFLQNNNV